MILVSINQQRFELALNDSKAAREFEALLPLTVEMKHVNGNEVYAPLGENFTSQDKQAGNIHAGDVKLWQGDGLVLFYEDFVSSYSYTDLGSILDSSGLAEALKHANNVTFMKEEKGRK
ncbi:cyclophilin-like fold protein [Streptococcus pneumoniae]